MPINVNRPLLNYAKFNYKLYENLKLSIIESNEKQYVSRMEVLFNYMLTVEENLE